MSLYRSGRLDSGVHENGNYGERIDRAEQEPLGP